jgi:hypothetical protein
MGMRYQQQGRKNFRESVQSKAVNIGLPACFQIDTEAPRLP